VSYSKTVLVNYLKLKESVLADRTT